ncbi:MAG: ferredoxin [Bacilli bacterium]
MAVKVNVNKDLCIGCGACTGICPNVFAIEDDGKAGVIGAVAPEDEGSAEEAAQSCPVSAIEIEK